MDVNVRDYGAVGNDITDDTLAFRNAITAVQVAGEGTIFVPGGTTGTPYVYKVSPSGIFPPHAASSIRNNMHLVGQKQTNSSPLPTLRIHNKLTNMLLDCRGDNWSIENIVFDSMDFYQDPTPDIPQAVVWCRPGNKWLITGCSFLNTGRRCIGIGGGSYWTIDTNYFNQNYAFSTGAHPPREAILGTSGIPDPTHAQIPNHGTIINNVSVGGGFGLMGHHHIIENNNITQAGTGTGIFLQNANTGTHGFHTVMHNVCSFGPEGLDDYQNGQFFQVNGFEIWTPYNFIAFNTAHDNCGGGMAIGGRNNIIAFNRAIDNGRDSGDDLHQHADGFISRSLSRSRQAINNSGSLWLGNVAHDTHPAGSKMQDYGMSVQSDNIRNLAIIENKLSGNNLGDGVFRNNAPNVTYVKGRDVFYQLCDAQMQEKVREFFNPNLYSLTDDQYLILNKLFAGSTLPRPT